MSEQIGPTGRFPEGQLRPDDKGELTVAFLAQEGKVHVIFGTPCEWMAMGPAAAEEMADKLRELAAEARRQEAGA